MKLFGLSALLLLGAQSSIAGERLYLQSGSLDIKSAIQDIQFLNQSPQAARLNTISLSRNLEKSFHLVQFKSDLLLNTRKNFESAGVQFVSYIPDHAYVVYADDKGWKVLRESEQIHVLAPYKGQTAQILNLDNSVRLKSVFDQDTVKTVDVYLFPQTDADQLADIAQGINVRVLKISDKVVRLQGRANSIQSLAGVEGIEWIEPARKMEFYSLPEMDRAALLMSNRSTTDSTADYSDLTGMESGTTIMNFASAWRKKMSGAGQIIAVSDSGLDLGVKESLSADFSNFLDGYVWGTNQLTWHDELGHGTHVMGSVGGTGQPSQFKIQGGAYSAQLIMQSLWSTELEGLTVPDDLGDIFKQAYANGARVHSNSWGNPSSLGVYDKSAQQVDQYMWDNPDMLILFAAGNGGADWDQDGRIDPGSVSSPATAKNIISVGASENEVGVGGIQSTPLELVGPNGKWSVEPLGSDKLSNNRNGLAVFSSRGPTKDKRLKPDLVAPGTNILSNCSKHVNAKPMWGKYNDDYCFAGGTSMATPLTAGAAAVVRGYLVSRNLKPSAALIKAVLLHTAFDMFPGQYGMVGAQAGQELLTAGPNFDQGYGRVDVDKAVTQRLGLVDEKVGLATGETKFYNLPYGVKKITLVYTDYPGALGSAAALVNDLDLELHFGDEIKASDSRINNTEQINLDQKFTGEVRIYVHGKSVPFGKDGKQPYALVFSSSI